MRFRPTNNKISGHVLMMKNSRVGFGLILASSPPRKPFNISNVTRARDLPYPYPEDLVIAQPRMRFYMKNQEINRPIKATWTKPTITYFQ